MRFTLLFITIFLLILSQTSQGLEVPRPSQEEVRKEEVFQRELAKRSIQPWRSSYILSKRLNQDQKRFLFTGYRLMLSATELVKLPEKKLACDPGFFLEKVPVGNEPYFRSLVEAGYVKPGQVEFVVNYVIPGSAAEKAGLRPGDVLVSIDGRSVTENTEPDIARRTEKVNTYISQMCLSAYDVHRVEILRVNSGVAEKQVLELIPDKIPMVGLKFLEGNKIINAWTDGKAIYVTDGIMNLFENDDQFAAVLAHELAHVILEHPEKTAKRAMVGEILGLAVDIFVSVSTGIDTRGIFSGLGGASGVLIFSKQQEREADYTMMYLLALSGYDYEKAPSIFRKLAQVSPGSIKGGYLSTHPGTAERYVLLEKVTKELKGLSRNELKNMYLTGMKEIKKEKGGEKDEKE